MVLVVHDLVARAALCLSPKLLISEQVRTGQNSGRVLHRSAGHLQGEPVVRVDRVRSHRAHVHIVFEAADLFGRQDAGCRVARGAEQFGQRSVELSRGEPTHGTAGRSVDLTLRWGLIDR